MYDMIKSVLRGNISSQTFKYKYSNMSSVKDHRRYNIRYFINIDKYLAFSSNNKLKQPSSKRTIKFIYYDTENINLYCMCEYGLDYSLSCEVIFNSSSYINYKFSNLRKFYNK